MPARLLCHIHKGYKQTLKNIQELDEDHVFGGNCSENLGCVGLVRLSQYVVIAKLLPKWPRNVKKPKTLDEIHVSKEPPAEAKKARKAVEKKPKPLDEVHVTEEPPAEAKKAREIKLVYRFESQVNQRA